MRGSDNLGLVSTTMGLPDEPPKRIDRAGSIPPYAGVVGVRTWAKKRPGTLWAVRVPTNNGLDNNVHFWIEGYDSPEDDPRNIQGATILYGSMYEGKIT